MLPLLLWKNGFLPWGAHSCPAKRSLWPFPGTRIILTSQSWQGPWRPRTSFLSSTPNTCCGSSRKGCLLCSHREQGGRVASLMLAVSLSCHHPASRGPRACHHQRGQINTAVSGMGWSGSAVLAGTVTHDGHNRGRPSPGSAPGRWGALLPQLTVNLGKLCVRPVSVSSTAKWGQ